MITRLDIAPARYGRWPSAPAVTITRVRWSGRDGVELRAADLPAHALVRIFTDRTQLGPCAGLLDGKSIVIDTTELDVLARVTKAWRELRGEWPAYVRGFRAPGYGGRSSVRHRAGEWEPEKLANQDGWRDGELTFRAAEPQQGETLGPLPIVVVLENALGERLGVAVRTPRGCCVTLVRGSLVVSSPWPGATRHFETIAKLLVSAATGDSDSLACLESSAEFDPLSACLLEVCDKAFVASVLRTQIAGAL